MALSFMTLRIQIAHFVIFCMWSRPVSFEKEN